MIIELQVVTPTGLSEEQKEYLVEFDKLSQQYGQHKEQEGFFPGFFMRSLGKRQRKRSRV